MVRIATLDDDGLLTPGQVPALATLGATATGEALIEAASAAAARTTLGLGTAAVAATGDFATAAQGSAADAALPAANLDTAATALDADAASALRVQQDARLSSTYGTRVEALAPRCERPRAARLTMISTFQSGHGWISGTWQVNDASGPVIGDQCLSLTTSTTSHCDASATLPGALDLTARHIAILVKVDSPVTNLNVITLLTSSDAGFTNYTNWQVVKGGSSEAASTVPSGVWTWVYATAASAGVEGDGGLSAVTHMKLRASAKSGVTTSLKVQALAHFPKPTAFPNGVVTISFDDCFSGQITKAAPLLAQYGYRGVIYVIRDVLDTTGYLTEAELDSLADHYAFDIAGHAWTAANHNLGFTSLSPTEAEEELSLIRGWLVDKGYRGSDHFAWPRGEDSATLDALARRYYSTCRAVSAGTEYYPLPSPVVGDMPNRMRAHVPAATTPPSVTTTMITRAHATGAWLQLGYHDIKDSAASGSTQYLTADFATVVAHIESTGIPVRTVTEVISAVNSAT